LSRPPIPVHRRHRGHLETWYGHRLISADAAKDVPGLKEIADLVTFGRLPPSTPVFYAFRRTDAPYPDACVALIVDARTVRDFERGDDTTVLELLDGLEDAYEQFMARVEAGKEPR
jgi:hypothetical protein